MLHTKKTKQRTLILRISGGLLVAILVVLVHGVINNSVSVNWLLLCLFNVVILSVLIGYFSGYNTHEIPSKPTVSGIMRKEAYASENLFSFGSMNNIELISQITTIGRFFYSIDTALPYNMQLNGVLRLLHESMLDKSILYFQFHECETELGFAMGVKPSTRFVSEAINPHSDIVSEALSYINAEVEMKDLIECKRIFGLLPFKRPQLEEKFFLVPVEYASKITGLLLVVASEEKTIDKSLKILIEEFAVNLALMIENHQKIEKEHKHEIEIAELTLIKGLREGLLPNTPPIVNTWEIAHEFTPSESLGGDFYFYFKLPDKGMLIVVGKASDTGLKAAKYISSIHGLIVGKMNEFTLPSQYLNYISCQVANSEINDMFSTVIIAKIKIGSRKVTVSSAGAPTALVNRAKSGYSEFAKNETGIPMGLLSQQDGVYSDHIIELLPGDGIFIYTDGITELNDTNNGRIGSSDLKLIFDRLPEAPAVMVLDSAMKLIRQVHENDLPTEDQTAIYIKTEC